MFYFWSLNNLNLCLLIFSCVLFWSVNSWEDIKPRQCSPHSPFSASLWSCCKCWMIGPGGRGFVTVFLSLSHSPVRALVLRLRLLIQVELRFDSLQLRGCFTTCSDALETISRSSDELWGRLPPFIPTTMCYTSVGWLQISQFQIF